MKVYSADEVTLSVGGLMLESGRGDDKFVDIEAATERFSHKSGIDGEVTISENKDETHFVTITLMQSSDGNDVLSALMQAATAGGPGAAVVPFVLRDNLGTTLLTSLDAVIAGWPKQPFGKEVQTVEWKLIVVGPKRHVGGNSGT